MKTILILILFALVLNAIGFFVLALTFKKKKNVVPVATYDEKEEEEEEVEVYEPVEKSQKRTREMLDPRIYLENKNNLIEEEEEEEEERELSLRQFEPSKYKNQMAQGPAPKKPLKSVDDDINERINFLMGNSKKK